ncbi:MAG: hypothetical protein WC436_05315 [Candidatus Babeliales bacterium]
MLSFCKSKFKFKIFLILILLIAIYAIGFIIFNLTCPKLAIINRTSRDRFGDQIIIYSKTKWLSYKYKIPFFLVTFEKSDKLRLFHEEKHCSELKYYLYPILYTIFGRYIKVRTENDIINALKTNSKIPTLFIVRISTKMHEHLKVNIDYSQTAWFSSLLYELMLQNPDFAKNLKNMLQPKDKIKKLTLPKDKITVAVHIRKGGGFDPELKSKQYYDTSKYNIEYKEIDLMGVSEKNKNNFKLILKNNTNVDAKILTEKKFSDQKWPEKFPPEQYYIEQIQKLSSIFNHQPIYVHIFTDDKNPKILKKQIKKAVNLSNIEFNYNKHNTNILQDYFAMTQFDCLIRSTSGFAYLAQMLGNHQVIMYPINLTWIKQDLLIVNKVGIIKKNN